MDAAWPRGSRAAWTLLHADEHAGPARLVAVCEADTVFHTWVRRWFCCCKFGKSLARLAAAKDGSLGAGTDLNGVFRFVLCFVLFSVVLGVVLVVLVVAF